MSKNPKINADGKYEGVVYKYTNKKTGKSYIGETDNEDKRRESWRRRADSDYGGQKIKDARLTYGTSEEVWDYVVLEKIYSDTHKDLQSQLDTKETEWIRKEDTVNNGYNNSYGRGNKGIKFSPERAKKCGNAMRGKHHTPEAKAKISESLKGRTVSEETRKKISESNTGKVRSQEHCQALSEAKKGIVPLAAKEGADRWREQNGGSYWKGKTMSDAARENMKKAQQLRGTDCIAKFPDGHEETYPTMLDAAKATGHNVGSVASAIKTGGITKNGFKFREV